MFHGIETIIHITTAAAIKISTESVLESNVSVFEHHFHKGRNLNEDTMENEMEVAMNGPNLVEADGLLKHSMELYWKGGKWHFIKRTDIRDFLNKSESQIIKRLMKDKSKLPFTKM